MTSILRSKFKICFSLGLSISMVSCGGGSDSPNSPTVAVTPPVSSTNTATLSWDASTSPNVKSYRAYYGTESRSYIQPLGQGIDMGNVLTYKIEGLKSGKVYYFAVTAVDDEGKESAYSDEAIKVMD